MNKALILIIIFIISINVVLLSIRSKTSFVEKGFQQESVLGINNIENNSNTIGNNIIQSSYLNPEFQDYRAFVLDKYFENNSSPLKGYGSEFIVACDKYGLSKDCSVIPAIAFAETKLCTQALSAQQFNCWGFGGSNENRITFNDFTESIEYVTRTLAKGYGDSLFRPEDIASTYCGGDCVNWGTSVNQQRAVIQSIASTFDLPSMRQ